MSKRIVLCATEKGRAVIYGTVDSDPVPGEPVTLRDARMVLCWAIECGGLFGLCAKGPKGHTHITHAVPSTTATVWKEYLEVTDEAAAAIDNWPPYE